MSTKRLDRNTWGLVLAAGEGRRLAALTTTTSGMPVPKQYCSLWGEQSLLQSTLRRVQAVVARERVCTIVAAHHRQWWEPPLWSLPVRNTIVQPEDRGTSIGVLLPLLHILQRDPGANVLLMPSDHDVRDEPVLARAMRSALAYVATHAGAVVLLGFRPDGPDPELGYLAPARPPLDDGICEIAAFVEKPALSLARELVERDALWNGFIVAASARALLALYELRYPQVVIALRRVAELDAENPADAAAAREAYDQLPLLDFSRDLLQGMETHLRVLAVPECGWTDLGSPAAVVKVVNRGAGRRDRAAGPWGVPTLSLSARAAAGTALDRGPVQ